MLLELTQTLVSFSFLRYVRILKNFNESYRRPLRQKKEFYAKLCSFYKTSLRASISHAMVQSVIPSFHTKLPGVNDPVEDIRRS